MKEHNSQTYHKTCGYDKIKSMLKLLACTVSAALCLSMSAAAYAEADVDGIQTTIGEAISTEAAESPYDSALTDDIYASATGTLNISGTQNYTYASQVITLLNEQRVNNGLSPSPPTAPLPLPQCRELPKLSYISAIPVPTEAAASPPLTAAGEVRTSPQVRQTPMK